MVPDLLNGTTISTEEFRDIDWIRFGIQPQVMRQNFNICGGDITVDHALQCKKGGHVTIRHSDVADEWDALYASALTPSAVTHKPSINYGGQRKLKRATEIDPEDEETEER